MQNESDLKLKKQKEFLIKFCYFGVIIGTTIIIIKVLGSILTPFLIAFIIAAILNPLIKFSCKKLHINRAIISILFVLAFYTIASFIIILIGAKLLVETLKQIEAGTAPRIKQGEEFTIAPMLEKEMSKINWKEKSAKEIKNLVRGLNPIMGTYSFFDGKKIKIWKVEVLPEENYDIENGTVIKADAKEGLYIKAKEGIISVLEIQGENAKRMNIKDFLRGNQIKVGSMFE